MLQISGLPPPPVEQATASAPYCSRTFIRPFAMYSSASSQEARRHLFSPRSPARMSGYLLRLG